MAALMRNGIFAEYPDIQEQDWIFLTSAFGSTDDGDDDNEYDYLVASMTIIS